MVFRSGYRISMQCYAPEPQAKGKKHQSEISVSCVRLHGGTFERFPHMSAFF